MNGVIRQYRFRFLRQLQHGIPERIKPVKSGAQRLNLTARANSLK